METALEDATGCCGPSDFEEPNTVCRNGHAIGNECGDCYTRHYVALDPECVKRVAAPESVTGGLDGAEPSTWLDVASSGSTSDRRRAIVLLGIEGSTAAVDPLFQIATDGPAALEATAVRALGRIGDEAAIPAVSTALAATAPSTRRTAARALGEIGGDAATSALLDRLPAETDASVCREIGHRVSGPVPIERLESSLDPETSEPASEQVLELLRIYGGDRAADVLASVVADANYSTSLREQAVWELTCVDGDEDYGGPDVDELLLDAVTAVETPSVRARCIEELRYRDGLDGEALLRCYEHLAELRNDPNAAREVRSAADEFLEE